MFLYDSAGMDDLMELYRATYQRAVSGEPAARSHFDVYLGDGALIHVREPCVREDVPSRVFVEVTPEDPKDPERRLPGWRRRYGLKGFSIAFRRIGVLFEGKCMAILPLPDYPVSGIRTGRDETKAGRVLWEARIPAR